MPIPHHDDPIALFRTWFDEASACDAIKDASDTAMAKAREAGAKDNIRVLDVEEIPLAYVPGGAVRLRVKAVGNLPLKGTTAADKKRKHS